MHFLSDYFLPDPNHLSLTKIFQVWPLPELCGHEFMSIWAFSSSGGVEDVRETIRWDSPWFFSDEGNSCFRNIGLGSGIWSEVSSIRQQHRFQSRDLEPWQNLSYKKRREGMEIIQQYAKTLNYLLLQNNFKWYRHRGKCLRCFYLMMKYTK